MRPRSSSISRVRRSALAWRTCSAATWRVASTRRLGPRRRGHGANRLTQPVVGVLAPGVEAVEQGRGVGVERLELEVQGADAAAQLLDLPRAALRAGVAHLLGGGVPGAQLALELLERARQLDDGAVRVVGVAGEGVEDDPDALRL